MQGGYTYIYHEICGEHSSASCRVSNGKAQMGYPQRMSGSALVHSKHKTCALLTCPFQWVDAHHHVVQYAADSPHVYSPIKLAVMWAVVELRRSV